MNKERLLNIACKVKAKSVKSDIDFKEIYEKLVKMTEIYHSKEYRKLIGIGEIIFRTVSDLELAVLIEDEGKYKSSLKKVKELGKELRKLKGKMDKVIKYFAYYDKL